MSDLTALPPTAAEKVAAFRDGPGREEPYAMATVVRTIGASACRPGDRFVVTRNGELIGVTGGGCMRGALRTAGLAAIAEKATHHIRIVPRARAGASAGEGIDVYSSSCPSEGEMDLFVEPILPAPLLFVAGESEVAQDVAALGRFVGFDVRTWRPETPDMTDAAPGGFAVVATQGQGDQAALEAALASGCAHVLFVSSRKKAAHWRAALEGSGVGEDRLAALIAPAGLQIDASNPREIAVSIIAQLIALRRAGEGE